MRYIFILICFMVFGMIEQSNAQRKSEAKTKPKAPKEQLINIEWTPQDSIYTEGQKNIDTTTDVHNPTLTRTARTIKTFTHQYPNSTLKLTVTIDSTIIESLTKVVYKIHTSAEISKNPETPIQLELKNGSIEGSQNVPLKTLLSNMQIVGDGEIITKQPAQNDYTKTLYRSKSLEDMKKQVLSGVPPLAPVTPTQPANTDTNKTYLVFGGGIFGGIGTRSILVNVPQSQDDKQISNRNAAETSGFSNGIHLEIGFSVNKKHSLVAEALWVCERFNSTKPVDWATGYQTDIKQKINYEFNYVGGGIAYHYSPAKHFILKTGLYYNTLVDKDDYNKQVNHGAFVGKAAIGYRRDFSTCFELNIMPTLYYNFTPVSNENIKTRLLAFGLTVGCRLFK